MKNSLVKYGCQNVMSKCRFVLNKIKINAFKRFKNMLKTNLCYTQYILYWTYST